MKSTVPVPVLNLDHPVMDFVTWFQREFLKRRRKNERYSLRAFAGYLNLEPATVSQLLAGKRRPSAKFVARLLAQLEATPNERDLILSSLKTEPGSTAVYSSMQKYQILTVDAFKLISDWYHYAILELISVRGFKYDLRWIAKQLDISVPEARQAIERLLRLELVDEKDGTLVKTNAFITNYEDGMTNAALKNLQRHVLQKALSAIDEVPSDQKDVTSMTMAIDETNALCSSAVMEIGLDRSKIQVVDTLTDLNTGLPINDEHLDAWTRPGNIQLRQWAWLRYLRPDDHLDASVNALILHEIYRTTESCDDDKGQLSTRAVQLLELPSVPPAVDPTGVYSRSFTFGYPAVVPHQFYRNPNDENAIMILNGVACEKPFDFNDPVPGIRCAFVGQDPSVVIGIAITTSDPLWPISCLIQVIVSPGVGGNWYILKNFLSLASSVQPLNIVFDLQTGSLAYGFDLTNLKLVPKAN